MAQNGKLTRRVIGMLSARLPELGFETVPDSRDEQGRKWSLPTLLNMVLLGLMAGKQNLAEVEVLSDELARGVRRRLKIPRRISDTTARDALVDVEPDSICGLIRNSAHHAARRKALVSDGFPIDVVAFDGKSTAVEDLDNEYAQTHRDKGGLGACGLVRTISCFLVTCTARVCLEVLPMGAKGNEVGFFQTAFETLLKHHRNSFDLVTYDAGAYSAKNAKLVVDAGKHYLFGLKDERKFLRQKAQEVLGQSTGVQAESETILSKKDNVRVYRRLFLAEAPKGYRDIKSVRTIVRIQSEKVDGNDKRLAVEDRYFISSLPHTRLTFDQWLELVRRHWAIECYHNVLDTSFKEDDHPWITHNAKGMLVVLLLRRLAYNILTLFKNVTQRSDEKRRTPWKTLFRWVANSLEQANDLDLNNLRVRKVQPAAS